MTSEIKIELPMPGHDLAGCRRGGERYGEELGERVVTSVRMFDRKKVLTEETNNLLFAGVWLDMCETAKRVGASGFSSREVRQFWRGMRRGYKSAMASAIKRKVH